MKNQSSEPETVQPAPAPPTIDLAAIGVSALGPAMEVGVCSKEQHPTLAGRVLVALAGSGPTVERWMPCLMQVRPREGDRVLVLRPVGHPEPVVVGVIDGYRSRVEPAPRAEHARRLRDDEAVRIEGPDGRGLVEVRASETGCVVTLLTADAKLATSGALAIEAETVSIRARQGDVAVSASDDVVVKGEHINLN